MGMTIMAEEFVITNVWQAHELEDANLSDLRHGLVKPFPTPDLETMPKVSDDRQLRAVVRIGKEYGYFEKVRWLYWSAQMNVQLFFSLYQMESDGVLEVPSDPLQRYLFLVKGDALFPSILSAYKRFVDEVDRILLKNAGGSGDEVYEQWKELTKRFYDTDFSYALLYGLRNCVEHDFWTISLVNYDSEKGTAGFAINIDNDLFNLTRLKGNVKDRLREWAIKRRAHDETAWLSVGKCINSYQVEMTTLYLLWLDYCRKRLISVLSEYEEELQGIPGNVLIWSGAAAGKHSPNSQPRVYHVIGNECIEELDAEFERAYSLLHID